MDIFRVTAVWTGFQGAPGYSNFHFAGGGGLISDAQQVAERVTSSFAALASQLPQAVRINVMPEVQIINSDSGEILDVREVEGLGSVAGTANYSYAAASGACVNWRTSDFRGGRRIRGRTFLVPLTSTAFESNGTLSSAGVTACKNFADGITGLDFDSEFGVWSRPTAGSGGVFATVTGSTVPDKAAVLRSRRD